MKIKDILIHTDTSIIIPSDKISQTEEWQRMIKEAREIYGGCDE